MRPRNFLTWGEVIKINSAPRLSRRLKKSLKRWSTWRVRTVNGALVRERDRLVGCTLHVERSVFPPVAIDFIRVSVGFQTVNVPA